jgi:hypothetical protein
LLITWLSLAVQVVVAILRLAMNVRVVVLAVCVAQLRHQVAVLAQLNQH